MAELALLIPGLVLLLSAALAMRRALRVARLVKRIPALAPEPLAKVADGLRLAKGSIESDEPLPSPFHARPCVYYAYRVEDGGPVPKRLATGKAWAATRLRDATGAVAVETRAALVRAPHATVTRLERLDQLTEAQRAFLRDAGIEQRHLGRFSALTITEYTLESGDEVHVLGTVQQRPDGKVFYRARHSPLAVTATRDAGLVPGLRNELLLFSASTALFLLFGILFLVASFA
ncbi:MAG: hypothetical protein HYT80_10415 [Euryarchaeota archaeon]|nr:hypothetical protein [Euryarchaeota archaeon]